MGIRAASPTPRELPLSNQTWFNMAKGEQRGNREAKKPKQEKPKATPAASPFAKPDTGATPARKGSGKK